MGKTLTLCTPRVADQYWAIQYFSCCLYVHSVSGIWYLVSGVWCLGGNFYCTGRSVLILGVVEFYYRE